MSQKDYYKIMGLSKEATEKEIKTAYRRLARKYHPDLSKETDAKEKFQALGEAYDVLKDPAKRKAYDEGKLFESQYQQAHAGGQQHYYQDFSGAGFGGFQSSGHEEMNADLFEALFGGGRFRQSGPHPGADRQATIHITLEEAYQGTTKIIQLPSADPAHPESKKIKVNIPAGIRAGQPIRLAGQGEPGRHGGPKGDLYLAVQVEKHPLFDVMGDDIYLTLPISPWEAALGCSIKVPTLGGSVDLKIPAGSQGGQTLRLRHRGLKGKSEGDQYVILKIMIPAPRTEAEKALYQKMAEEMPFNPREKWGERYE